MNNIKWLQSFFSNCCDGDWEHQYGIKITTIDNPGWAIDVNLNDTFWENIPYEKFSVDRNDEDWIVCSVKKSTFKIRCGIGNLGEGIEIFRAWVESHK